MRYLVCLAIFALARARVINDQCDGIVVHNIKHEKDILKDGLDSPYQLAIDYDTNTLFFSLSVDDGNDVFQSAYLNLKTNEYGTISGIAGGFANAVDKWKNKVYLGGNNGIYTFDFESKNATHIDGTEHSVWEMFYKDRLYYTDYNTESAWTYENGQTNKVEELKNKRVMLLAIDNNNNILFANSSGLYAFKKAKSKEVILHSDVVVNGFTSDINGNIYFSTPNALFAIDENLEIKKLASLYENVYGIAIEGDDSIIYANQNSIVRLRPTKTMCYQEEDKSLKNIVEDSNNI